jgi:hypothetical protein
MMQLALVTPSLQPIASFDVTESKDITFISSGGDKPVKAILNINVQNKTYQKSYISSVSSSTSEYIITLPANFLTGDNFGNDVTYEISVSTYNYQGQISEKSNIQIVTAYTNPEIVIVSPETTHESATLTCSFTYSQKENESINKYSFRLLNSIGTQLDYSGDILYSQDKSLSYQFKTELANDGTYIVEVNVVTVGNTNIIKTKTFVAQYIQASDYFPLIIDNSATCENGAVVVKSKFVLFEGEAYPSPPIYIDNDYVSLVKPGSYVIFDKGFEINGDFALIIKFNSPVLYPVNKYGDAEKSIIEMTKKNEDSYIIINVEEGISDTNKVRAEVCIKDGPFYYRVLSDYINKADATKDYRVVLRKIDNLCDISFEVVDK